MGQDRQRVVIGMDPHKRSVTIEVMTADEDILCLNCTRCCWNSCPAGRRRTSPGPGQGDAGEGASTRPGRQDPSPARCRTGRRPRAELRAQERGLSAFLCNCLIRSRVLGPVQAAGEHEVELGKDGQVSGGVDGDVDAIPQGCNVMTGAIWHHARVGRSPRGMNGHVG